VALPLLYNLRNLRVRWPVTLLAVLGVALVVAVSVGVLSMAEGFLAALRASGRADNALVLRRGVASELMSQVPLDERNLILDAAGRLRGERREVLASWERQLVLSLPRKSDGRRTNVILRGVSAQAFEVHGGVRLLRGRRFKPGLAEVIVGRRIQRRVRGLELGATLRYRGRDFRVVGSFAADGAAFESEVWTDVDVLASLFQLGPGSNSLLVRLDDSGQVAVLDRWLGAQPRMQLIAVPERRYYEQQAGPVVTALEVLAALIAAIMGAGAVFGVMNTMYAVVAARTREIGALRALGFSRGAILVSFVLESALLALAGGVLGCLLAALLQGHATGASNLQSLSEVAFAFRVTPRVVTAGLLFSVVMGVLGGLLPALRAARLPIAGALRAA
jgi:putative ABC transport system permease protein